MTPRIVKTMMKRNSSLQINLYREPFHLKRSLVNPPAVEDATSLWYEIVMVVEDFTSLD